MTENEMIGWDHQCNGHEFEQAPGVGDGQRSLDVLQSIGYVFFIVHSPFYHTVMGEAVIMLEALSADSSLTGQYIQGLGW